MPMCPAPEPTSGAPVRVAVVNDYAPVIAGLLSVLEEYPDQIRVVASGFVGKRLPADVEVVLYDTFGSPTDVGEVASATSARVAAYTWDEQSDAVARALAGGASGYLSKRLSAEQLVRALHQLRNEEVVTDLGSRGPSRPSAAGGWPGQADGLSGREAEMVALMARGLTNDEIARLRWLSGSAVRVHLRSAYRTLGLTGRTDASRWALEHGFGAHEGSASPGAT